MVNIINALAVMPSGLWEKIIFAFNGVFKNYALAIIILTLCIKLVLLPVDFINRRSSAKMTEIQTKLQPKMAEIQRKYPDKNVQNQKLGELYQKEGFNPMGSCITMLVVMVITMAVFFGLFSGLNSMASYKIVDQYEQLQKAYVSEYVQTEYGKDVNNLTQEEIDGYIVEIYRYDASNEEASAYEARVEIANQAVLERYDEVRESFLWIKNVWIADSPFARAIPNFDSYAQTAGLTFENETAKAEAKSIYNAVMGKLEETQGVNGYYILAVLAAVTTFLSQYLLSKKKKQKDNYYTKQQDNQPMTQQASTNKAMMIIFPIIMLVFTLSYNSIFALYIVTGQLFTMATTPLISKLIEIADRKKDKKAKVVKK